MAERPDTDDNSAEAKAAGHNSTAAQRWADLRPRVLSAIVMLAVGYFVIFQSNLLIVILTVMALTGVLVWELAQITARPARRQGKTSLAIALCAALSFGAITLIMTLSVIITLMLIFDSTSTDGSFLAFSVFGGLTPALGTVVAFSLALIPLLILLPSAILLLTPQRDRLIAAIYALAIMLACLCFLMLSLEFLGVPLGLLSLPFAPLGLNVVFPNLPFALIWLVGIVIVSDLSGYFVGRFVGGPKFWPALSPKKTWSGTIAGWISAVALGWAFVIYAGFSYASLWVAPLIAFAGQMGDIAESWVKRRAGVKDSSRLIPGHGGFLDRFDAVIGALLAFLVIFLFFGRDLFVALPLETL